MAESKTKIDWKRLAITTAIVLVTAGVVFGITWYIMDKSINENQEVSDKLRVELQNQITTLRLKLNNK